ncbi:MAG: PAS domain S-box protein [Kiritimatiellae bacterium]|nr:PAS domain S-box protein [Kiritimatiellia bacterium]
MDSLESSRGNADTNDRAPAAARTMRVLLIDDDEGDRLIIRRALEKAHSGVALDETDHAPSDFIQLAGRHYDAILLDHLLPGSDAFQFLDQAREAGLKTPVVVVTGYEEEILDIELMEAGAAAFLSKDRLTPNTIWRTLLYAARISRAEQAQRQSEERLRTQYQNLPIATLTWQQAGDDFVLIDSNQAASRLTHGVIDTYRGLKASEIHSGRPDIREDLLRCAREKSIFANEVTYVYRTTGEVRHIRANYAFAPPDLVITHLDDVTERQQAEALLQREEEKYRLLAEESPLGVSIIGSDDGYKYLNSQFVKIFGYTLADLPNGSAWFAKAFPDEAYRHEVIGLWKSDLAAARPGECRPRTFSVRCKDGTAKDVYFRPVTMSTGDQFVIYEDITERRQAEVMLRKMQFAIEHSADAVVWATPEGRFVYVNDAACRLAGYSREELLKMTVADLDVNATPDLETMFWDELRRAGHAYHETTVKARDGRLIPVDVMASHLSFGDQELNCSFVRDITARKTAEQKQEALTAGLRAVVHIADELIGCESVDALCRRAVELAREKLGIERCSIFLRDGGVLRGAYGTNLQGHTTDERSCALPDGPDWERLFVPAQNGDPRWILRNKPLANWTGRAMEPAGGGWNACTPISQARQPLSALFFNDAAISGAPFDPVKQELVAILCSTLADIIERKKAESALRQSEERFREMAELLPETVFEVDTNGRLTFANRTAFEMFGYDQAEFERGLSAMDMFRAEDRARLLDNLRAVMAGERVRGQEYCAQRKDGRTFPVVAYSTRIVRDGKAAGVRGFLIDVTARKDMENALRDSVANFKALAENAIDGILILGENGLHVYANTRAVEITGYSADELRQMGLADLAHPDEVPKLLAQAEARLGGAEAPSRYETVIVTRDGRNLPVEVSATRTLWQGRPAGMAIIQDITARRLIEDERRSFAARLMEVQEEERKEISAVLHDHLGQLLTLANLELSEPARKGAKPGARIEAAKQRIDEALAAVRDMAISLRPPLLDDLGLEAALETLTEEFGDRSGLRIRLDRKGSLPALDAQTKTCLYRVLQEALTNVAKHARATQVVVNLRAEDGDIILEVADNGIGLAEPPDSSHKGMGLVGMRERIERLGGSLAVIGGTGRGAHIVVRISADRSARERGAP